MNRVLFVMTGMAVAVAFALGLGNVGKEACAAVPVPPACPKYECKTIHAWWPGGAGVQITACHAAGGAANSDTAYTDIFTDSSVEKKPQVVNGTLDYWQYPSCLPVCGKDPTNKKWQAPQQVTKMGVGVKGTGGSLNAARHVCTASPGGGPLAGNQGNQSDPGDPPIAETTTVP